MSETQKQIDRAKRIKVESDWYYEKKRILDHQFNLMVKQDKEQQEALLEKCKQAVMRKVEQNSCDCCPVVYPDVYYFTEGGLLFYRYEADHPNDFMDFEVNIDELLG